MLNPLRMKSWSPFVAGAGIGILSGFAFATADHPIGITTAFENTAALTGQVATPELAERLNEKKAAEGKAAKIDWEWMLVVGVFIGSWLSATMGKDREMRKVPSLWSWRFGPSVAKRFSGAFLGGALMMFGARLAQGCTSGHGISGSLQLALSSWIFVVLIFASAVATTFLLYGKEGRRHV
jgi:uncharacterized protein